MLATRTAISARSRYAATMAIMSLFGCGGQHPTASGEARQAPSPQNVASPATAGGPGCAGLGLRTAKAYGSVSRLAGAFSTNAGEINDWLASRGGPTGPGIVTSQSSSLPTGTPMSVCYYDGQFRVAKGPPGQAPPVYTRIDILVPAHGQAYLDAAGTQQNLRISAPQR